MGLWRLLRTQVRAEHVGHSRAREKRREKKSHGPSRIPAFAGLGGLGFRV